MKDVYINKIAKFLPNKPVSNDEMEEYLGQINNTPSKSKSIVLRRNGITSRYYAMEKGGKATHTSASINAAAAELLFDEHFTKDMVEILGCGTSMPDQFLPSHAAMVCGELGLPPVEIISPSGSCCTGIQAMQYAFLYLKSGMKNNAVVSAGEVVSQLLHARHFEAESERLQQLSENGIVAFEKDFLRWMLSDGSGAAFLQNEPNKIGLSLKIDFLETRSYAGQYETCMYMGALKNEDGSLTGWNTMEPQQWLTDSVFPFKQDVKLLGANILHLGTQMLSDIAEKHQFDVEAITYFCPHISSYYFKERTYDEMAKAGFEIPWEKWFTNLSYVGNIGSASVFVMIEELMNAGKLKKGDKILCMVPESARFTYAWMQLTAV